MRTATGFSAAFLSFVLGAGVVFAAGDCSDYVDLSGQPLPITVSGTTAGATNDYGPFPSCPPVWVWSWSAASSAGRDVTYKWTVPETGRYTMSLRGSGFDTSLLVYNFTCPEEPTYPPAAHHVRRGLTDPPGGLPLQLRTWTGIEFYLPAAGRARLEVFDVRGRRVASLVDGMRSAGLHTETWSAADAAPGLYFARLQAGGASALRPLVRVR